MCHIEKNAVVAANATKISHPLSVTSPLKIFLGHPGDDLANATILFQVAGSQRCHKSRHRYINNR